MRLVPIEHVADGMRLARAVPSNRADRAPLLRAGTTMTVDLAHRVGRTGMWAIWVDDDLGEAIVPAPEFPADTVGLALNAVSMVFEAAHSARTAKRALAPQSLHRLHDAAAEIAECVLEYPVNACPVPDLPAVDAGPQWHAVRVALLGTFIGRLALIKHGWTDHLGTRRFDCVEERLTTLATGLLVHDVGVPAPSFQLDGIDARTIAETDQPVEHVTSGADLFPAGDTSAGVRVVIQSHHERWDGMGYPNRRKRDAIPPNARICAVADAYDALISRSHGNSSVPLHCAVATIEQGSGTLFDPATIGHFKKLVLPYPIGHELVLPDGRDAVVTKLERSDRLQPTVRLRSESGQLVELIADLSAPQPLQTVAA
jgi:hypothetical protein